MKKFRESKPYQFLLPIGVFLLYVLFSSFAGLAFKDKLILTQLLCDIVFIFVCFSVYQSIQKRGDENKFKPRPWFWLFFVVGAILVWYMTQYVGAYIEIKVPNNGLSEYQVTANSDQALFLVMSVFIAPIMEELLFRGVLYGYWRKIMPKLLAACLSSALFAAIHGTLVHLSLAFFMGLACVYLYEMTGHIRYSIVFHFLYNAFSASILTRISEDNLNLVTSLILCGIFVLVFALFWKNRDATREFVTHNQLLDEMDAVARSGGEAEFNKMMDERAEAKKEARRQKKLKKQRQKEAREAGILLEDSDGK